MTTSKFYKKCEEMCIAKVKWHSIGVFDIENTQQSINRELSHIDMVLCTRHGKMFP